MKGVFEKPDKSGWIVRWREGATNKSRTLNKSDGFREKDAVALKAEINRRHRLGAVDLGHAEQKIEDFILTDWWPAHQRNLAPSTRETQYRYLTQRIVPRFKGYRLCDINVPAVKTWDNELAAEGVGAPTRIKLLACLSSIFTEAQVLGKVDGNPVLPIKKPSQSRKRVIHPLPPEAVEKLRAQLPPERATFISVLAYAGARPEEALKLRWNDIEDTHLILSSDKTKRDRSVRLLEPLRDDLRAFKGSGHRIGRVFDWGPTSYKNWSRKDRGFGIAAQAAGLDATPYDLRHSFVSLLLAEGRDLYYVAQQLGHSLQTCNNNYVHLEHLGEKPVPAEERIYAARQQKQERVADVG